MRKVVRWTAYALGSIVALALVAFCAVYGRGAMILNRHWDAAGVDLAIPTDTASIARGHHLAASRGCLDCHGPSGRGLMLFDQPNVARIAAPNIARLARVYRAADFDRIVRHGVRPNGMGVAIMPSNMFANFTDGDMASVIAYLRTLDSRPDTLPPRAVKVLGYIGLGTGQFELTPQVIARQVAGRAAAPAAQGDTAARGRYIALTSCTECHGPDLRGAPAGSDLPAPNLMIAAGYSRDQFARLMRTGVPANGRKLSVMGIVARGRFANFDDDEITALHRYLTTLAR